MMPDTEVQTCPDGHHCPTCLLDRERDACCECGASFVPAPFWPFEPWRMILLATILIAIVPVGIEAARPVFNGADVMALVLLGAFAALFFIRSKES
ncbi:MULTISPECIES: hypothetical protein [Bacteria]|uniref:Uncharacterized protein n=1 Tax=Microbacterium phage Min1 TaxID=446529 RepID=A6N1X0_9CAUD|nr:hypothetical protein MPMin1_gp12 [Microbacterium phage Min1]ABR10442.1 hypothetical protein [Microbacterium phage Min1]